MMIWLTLLPFTLWDSCGWATLPITGIVSFLLLGIEEIGVSIEEPFTILPLETIARTIEANLRELEATHGPATLGTKPEGAKNAEQLLYEIIPSLAPGNAALANGSRVSSIGSISMAQDSEPVLVSANGSSGPEETSSDPIVQEIYKILRGQNSQ
jgi:hypothetical protein